MSTADGMVGAGVVVGGVGGIGVDAAVMVPATGAITGWVRA